MITRIFSKVCAGELTGNRFCATAILLGSMLLALPGHAQVCEDTDGDGWGWDGTSSCLVEAANSDSGNNGSNGESVCVDSDGDGYGWDGTATCVVGAQSQGGNNQAEAGNSNAGACVDSDGDGWGWNGRESCQMSPASDTSTDSPEEEQQDLPVPLPPAPANSDFDSSRDLVALHFDHAPDRDDGHAAVAALMVTDRLQLNVQVVAGTYGVYSRDRYDGASESLMSSVWGSAWLNAHSDREGSVAAAVNRWTAILAAGGNVWVAEGGTSDFTAAVVARINANHSEFNTRQRIHVIQHSDWNEDHSLATDLNYVRNNTRYVKIADGNNPNATADLRFESHNNGAFVSRAQSGRYASEWGVAFNYLSPGEKLDFSDTVELLHIVGLGASVISDVNDFGDYFF